MPRVLIVDDDAVSCQLLAEVLQGDGVQVLWETEPAAALAAARRAEIDLAILDLRMPQMNGLALMEALRADAPTLPVMIMTGSAEPVSRRWRASSMPVMSGIRMSSTTQPWRRLS